MLMRFTKMQGAGNDFIVVNDWDGKICETSMKTLAETLCQRRMSVGADGMMFVRKPQAGGDFRMEFFNADGSRGEMCGNGARCIARYGYEKGLAGSEMTIETTAGPVKAWRISAEQFRIRLNDVTQMELSLAVEACGKKWDCSYVELGDPGLPHLVVEYPGLRSADEEELRQLGAALRSAPSLPKGANVNFYEMTGPDTLWEKTFERGVEDFTFACGTGTGSVAAVLTEKGVVTGEHTTVAMTGGILYVDVVRTAGRISDLYLSGPAVIVYEGDMHYEDYEGTKGYYGC